MTEDQKLANDYDMMAILISAWRRVQTGKTGFMNFIEYAAEQRPDLWELALLKMGLTTDPLSDSYQI